MLYYIISVIICCVCIVYSVMPIADEPKRRQYANTQNLFEQENRGKQKPMRGQNRDNTNE